MIVELWRATTKGVSAFFAAFLQEIKAEGQDMKRNFHDDMANLECEIAALFLKFIRAHQQSGSFVVRGLVRVNPDCRSAYHKAVLSVS